MPTEPLVEFPFAGGVDESVRDEIVDPAKAFTVLENVRQPKAGGACKRLGFRALPRTRLDGTNRESGRRLLMNDDHVCTVDGSALDVRSSTLGASVLKGRLPEAVHRLLEAPTLGVRTDVADVVSCGGYVVVSWIVHTGASGSVSHHYAAVLDPADGAIVRGPEMLDSFVNSSGTPAVRLAKYGDRAVAFTCDALEREVRMRVLRLEDRVAVHDGWGPSTTVVTDYLSAFAASSLEDRVAIAYGNDGSVDDSEFVTVMTVDDVGIGSSVRLSAPGVPGDPGDPLESPVAPDGVDLSEGGTTLWVAYNVGPEVKVVGLDPSNVDGPPVASAATVADVSPLQAPSRVFVAPSEDGSTGRGALLFTAGGTRTRPFEAVGGATVAAGSETAVHGVQPAGRPFLRDGRLYAPFSSSQFGEVVLCEWTPDPEADPGVTTYLRPVVNPIFRGLFAASGRMRCRTAAVTPSTYFFGFLTRKTGTSTGTALVEYDFAPAHPWRAVRHGRSTYVSGGVLTLFDGDRIFEAGFLTRPSTPTTSTSEAGALTFTKGGRRYVATYEHVDADGNRHISGVSDPSEPTGNVDNKRVDVSTSPLAITLRGSSAGISGSSVKVVFWATRDGEAGPYFRVTNGVDATRDGVANSPQAERITLVDNYSDLVLSAQEKLYAPNLPGTGGAQDRRAPPGSSVLASYNGMLVCGAGRDLVFSGQPVDGEGTWFNPVFTVPIGEEVTGLAVQDVLAAFARRSVWTLAGEAPSDDGGGGLGLPRRLPANVGCVSPASVVATDLGVLFLSERGYEVFTRAQSVEPAGDPVQETLAAFPHVSAAVLDSRNGLVRISLAAAREGGVVSGAGRDIVFDLKRRIWTSVDRKHGAVADEPSQDAAMVRGADGVWRYAWLGTDGTVWVEKDPGDEDAHLDGEAMWIVKAAETGNVKVAGLQGEQRMESAYLLAHGRTPHRVIMSMAHDYSEAFTEVRPFTEAQTAPARPTLHAGFAKFLGQAVRVRVEDAPPSSGPLGTGEGSTWVALTFNGEPRSGPRRTVSGQRSG